MPEAAPTSSCGGNQAASPPARDLGADVDAHHAVADGLRGVHDAPGVRVEGGKVGSRWLPCRARGHRGLVVSEESGHVTSPLSDVFG